MGNKPIVHAPVATGSTEPRDIRDRFADFINVKDFGAKGDGITDDSAAWAAWRTALQNGGMPYIPKGDYLLGEEIIHAPKGHWGRNTSSFSFEDDGQILGEFSSPIYLDPAGSDTNDGLTSSTAVQTFEKAMEIGESLPGHQIKLIVSAGTYNSSLVVSGTTVKVVFLGNTTINGQIASLNTSFVALSYEGTEPTVTVSYTSHSNADTRNSPFYAHGNSYLYSRVPLVISAGTSSVKAESLIGSLYDASVYIAKPIQIAGYANNGFYSIYGSSIFMVSDATLSNNSVVTDFINAATRSLIMFGANCSISGSSTGRAITADSLSYIVVFGTANLSTTGSSYYSISINNASAFNGNTINLTRNQAAGGVAIASIACSSCLFGSLTVTSVNSVTQFMQSIHNANIRIASYLKLSGTATGQCVQSTEQGLLILNSNATVVNNASGRRYGSFVQSYISSGGAGENRFPGDDSGETDSTSIYA